MDELLSSYLHDERARASRVEPMFQHRLAITGAWDILPGSRILDIGCGQGESSLVLALTNGPYGHIMGIDSAPPDYGGPYTLEKSQRHIKGSKLGDRIEFLRADPARLFLFHNTAGRFDVATLCHSLWYFPSRGSISDVFRRLADAGVRRLCLAEYGFRSSRPEQVPHVLAARAQTLFHALRKSAATGLREPNIRTALTPAELVDIAAQLGWRERRSGYLQPSPKMRDGQWEVQFVTSPLFQQWIEAEGLKEDESLVAAISEVESSTRELRASGVEQWETMDVFWAVLELDSPI